MWSSPLIWIAFAVVLFWALGAYNRLMRLRSAVVQAFGSFDAHMVRLGALLGELHAAHTLRAPSLPGGGASQELAALHGATTQLSASLAVARARPLQPDAIAALSAARSVLAASWLGVQRTSQQPPEPRAPGAGLAGPNPNAVDASPSEPGGANVAEAGAGPGAAEPWPSPLWRGHWSEQAQHIDQAVRVFNDAVTQYNAAIGQFPASLLAWAFGFKAARPLENA